MTAFAAVLVAAGSGQRLSADRPKALVEVAGRPLVHHAAARLAEAGATSLVVAAPPGWADHVAAALPVEATTTVVDGGATRAASVRAGLAAVDDPAPIVAVHDAARPFAPAAMIRRTVAAVTGDVVAAAPAVPIADTIKRVEDDRVVGTVDRSSLVGVQTPQVFVAEVLRRAHAAGGEATDDLALVEAAILAGTVGGRVVVVPGAVEALKVTHPHDLRVAALVADVAA